jgi:hypothetical protein
MMQYFDVFLPACSKPWKNIFNVVHDRINSIVISSNLKLTFASLRGKFVIIFPAKPRNVKLRVGWKKCLLFCTHIR